MAISSDAAIAIKEFDVWAGSSPLILDVNWQIMPNERWALLGGNGCVVAGLAPGLQTADLILFDALVDDHDAAVLAKKGAAFGFSPAVDADHRDLVVLDPADALGASRQAQLDSIWNDFA